MTIRRLWYILRLWSIRGSGKRAAYARKNHIYAAIGDDVTIMDRKIPLYANLIKFHNNIEVASDVLFITHDVTHCMLNKYARGGTNIHYQEAVGCIEVMDNMLIGSGTIVLSNVRIGPNVIVAAGSVITKDVPPNTVVGGVPTKVICSFDEYIENRKQMRYPHNLAPSRQEVDIELASYLWNEFISSRDK